MRRLSLLFLFVILQAAFMVPATTWAQCPNCTTPPAADKADFKMGTPTWVSPDSFTVSLQVDTDEDITFTQMTLQYDPNCLAFEYVLVGQDVSNVPPGAEFVDDTSINANTNQLLLNVTGEYTGCNQEVFVVVFRLIGTPPCDLTWDATDGGPNSKNHLNYAVGLGGTDGKITPANGDITFCGEQICDFAVEVDGDVTYYSNGQPIIANTPTGAPAVTVKNAAGANPTTTAMSPNATYSLDFGQGPVAASVTASRTMAQCGSDEDGVLSGDDVIVLQDEVAAPGGFSAKQNLAGDVNGDGNALPDNSDVLALKRWIGRKVCDGSDACSPVGQQIKNCAATWKFIFFGNPNNQNAYTGDSADLGNLCADQTVPIEGILIGDVDGSWPDYFLKPSAPVALVMNVKGWEGDIVTVSLSAELQNGQSLRHLIYSLGYDDQSFEYLGMSVGSAVPDWGSFDNAEQLGWAHGIAHRPPRREPLVDSGEVAIFRFRALSPDARSEVYFTRLKTNDMDVQVPSLTIDADDPDAVENYILPSRFSLRSHPNPFNPLTRVEYTIPDGIDGVPVQLLVYDIAGRLVRTLETAHRAPGRYSIEWNGTSDDGTTAGTGIYFLRIHAGDWSATEKLTLVK